MSNTLADGQIPLNDWNYEKTYSILKPISDKHESYTQYMFD